MRAADEVMNALFIKSLGGDLRDIEREGWGLEFFAGEGNCYALVEDDKPASF